MGRLRPNAIHHGFTVWTNKKVWDTQYHSGAAVTGLYDARDFGPSLIDYDFFKSLPGNPRIQQRGLFIDFTITIGNTRHKVAGRAYPVVHTDGLPAAINIYAEWLVVHNLPELIHVRGFAARDGSAITAFRRQVSIRRADTSQT